MCCHFVMNTIKTYKSGIIFLPRIFTLCHVYFALKITSRDRKRLRGFFFGRDSMDFRQILLCFTNINSIFYNLTVAPSLITRPTNQTVIESKTVTFNCSATGNPTPKITWLKDGTTVGHGETLSFEATRNQSGKYWCTAENGLSVIVNASAILDVQCK